LGERRKNPRCFVVSLWDNGAVELLLSCEMFINIFVAIATSVLGTRERSVVFCSISVNGWTDERNVAQKDVQLFED
jgi:hypothetical protein